MLPSLFDKVIEIQYTYTWKSYGIKLWHENVENPTLQDTNNAFAVVDEIVKNAPPEIKVCTKAPELRIHNFGHGRATIHPDLETSAWIVVSDLWRIMVVFEPSGQHYDNFKPIKVVGPNIVRLWAWSNCSSTVAESGSFLVAPW